jgi:hypothetical protein
MAIDATSTGLLWEKSLKTSGKDRCSLDKSKIDSHPDEGLVCFCLAHGYFKNGLWYKWRLTSPV